MSRTYAAVPQSSNHIKAPDFGPQGLGGYLFFVMAVLLAISTFQIYNMLYHYGTMLYWFQLSSSNAYRAGFMIRVISDLSLLMVASATVFFFFKKSPRFPDTFNLWISTLFLTCLFMDICFMYDDAIIPNIGYPMFLCSQLSLIMMAATVPYLISSRRVRNTFFNIQRYSTYTLK